MRRGGGARTRLPDVLGVAWTVAAVVAVMAPVLRPGIHLGAYDLLTRIGLTRQPGVAVHSQFPADQVLYFLPLTNLAWHQVHAGHLPLWNPYNVLGVPLAFTWQSAVFSVPVLLSYLVPVNAAYTVVVLVKLVLAGTGAYTLCRVLGAGPLGAAFAGTAFELSGPMVHYSGWAMTGVTCWAGWIFAAAVVLVRGEHRLRTSAWLTAAVAAAVYGGHPESLLVLAVSLAVFVVVLLVARARREGAPWRRPAVDLAVAGACGLALGMPLILPGLQVVGASGRAGASGGAAFSLVHLSDLATGLQGTDFRVPSPYMGAVVLVLALVALRLWWRRSEVLGLGAVAVVGLVLVFKTPLYSLVQNAPGVGQITWNRDVMLLALAVAVLGGLGVDTLARGEHAEVVHRWAWRAFVGAAVVVAAVGLAVAGGAQHTGDGSAAARLATAGGLVLLSLVLVRLWWRAGAGAPGASSTEVAAGRGRPARRASLWAVRALVAAQGVVLAVWGASFWSLSAGTFPATSATAALQRAVGSSVVSLNTCRPRPFSPPYSTETGIRPNANIAYGVHEFAVYEPALPKAYYASWEAASGQHLARSLRRVGLFCPEITTAAEARLYGIGYVLTPRRTRGPRGAVRDGSVSNEELFRIPGAAQATLSALGAGATAPGTAVTLHRPSPSSLRVVTDAPGPRLLRLRVTALPGWHATVDGRSVAAATWAEGSMLEVRVPAGHHVVALDYFPGSFSAGLGLAGLVLLGFAVAATASWWRRRGRAISATR